MRQDSNRIYRYYDFDSTEYLIFDFNLIPGDTFITPLTSADLNSYSIIVDSVNMDSVGGLYRKHLYFDNGQIWIEGLGDLWFATQSWQRLVSDRVYELLCYHLNDTTHWTNPYYPSCSEPLSINKVEHNDFRLPNPITSGLINIPKTQTIHLYRIDGTLVCTAQNSNKLDVSFLRDGVYIFKLENELFSRKIIILN
ncbi:MAG: T9SS type A sorting domain-containing protein [Flavobacteriales bacterium]|nr:T9SS type A sorting domain-containing protein [Flavobacteriales bacterium]